MANMLKLTLKLVLLSLLSTQIASAWRETNPPLPLRNQKKPIDDKFYKFWERNVLETLLKFDYDSWFKRFVRFHQESLEASVGSHFTCPAISKHEAPTTVHRLTPSDIKIVAALGDSITTGFGARSKRLVDLFVEFRDISWSIGGKGKLEEATTLPNILKKYNPLVQGFSTIVTPVSKRIDQGSANNFAKSGGTAESLPEKAEELMSFIKESSERGFKRDWKLITIFIGGQDLCLSCHDQDFRPKHFVKKIAKTLEKIQEEMPKVFVNLVQLFDVSKLMELSSPYCRAFQKVTCPCAAGTSAQRAIVSRTAKEYSRILKNLVNSPKFQDTPEFAVVLQPFLSETLLPRHHSGKIDQSYFSPDCFHLSTKGHAAMATALWNNMLQPVGFKSKSWHSGDSLTCPRPDFPFFFTKTNSQEYLQKRPPMNIYNFPNRGHSLHKSVKAEIEAKEKKEMEQEAHHRALGIAIGSGIAIAAMAVGIVIFTLRRRHNGPVVGFAREQSMNYNSCEQETLM